MFQKITTMKNVAQNCVTKILHKKTDALLRHVLWMMNIFVTKQQ